MPGVTRPSPPPSTPPQTSSKQTRRGSSPATAVVAALVACLLCGVPLPSLAADATPPTSTITTPVNGSGVNSLTALTGTATDDLGLDRVEVTLRRGSDGLYWDPDLSAWGSSEVRILASGTGSWSVASGLPAWEQGSYTVKSIATDLVGNEQVVDSSVTFTFDSLAPTGGSVSVSKDAAPGCSTGHLTLSASDATAIQVYVDGDVLDGANVRVWIAYATAMDVELVPTHGLKRVTVRFRDAAGNATDPIPGQVDLDGPWYRWSGGDHGGADWTPAAGQELAGQHVNVGAFLVDTGTTVCVRGYDGSARGELGVEAQTVSVQGTLNGVGRGYRGGEGPGAGVTGEVTGGGGYGGRGGTANAPWGGNTAGGPPYGVAGLETDPWSFDDIQMGSGGGNFTWGSYFGGPGGAKVYLAAVGSATVSGMVDASGTSGNNSQMGGGSGGGVLIVADSLTATGTVRANGGSVGGAAYGGAGGGGRIKLVAATIDLTGATLQAAVGAGGSTIGAEAGTILLDMWPTDLGLSPASVAENLPTGTTVGTLTTTDPDAGDSFTYSLVAGDGDTDNASFTIVGDQLLTAAIFDFETKSGYSVRVRTTDFAGLWYEGAFTVTVTDANDAPTDLALWPASVAENLPTGTTIGTLTTTDPDAGNSFTYVLVAGDGDTDNASFTIVDDQLRTAAIFDFESKSSYSVRVRTTDSTGLWYEEAFSVTVTDANDPPELQPVGDRTVAEGEELVIVVSADDVDGHPLTYSVVNLPEGAAFDPASGTFTWTPGYDQAGSWSGIRFEVSDGELTDFEEITVTVTDHDAVIFADDFSDGTAEGDPDWEEARGAWKVSDAFTYVASPTRVNRALVQGDPLVDALATGVIESRVKLPRTAVKAPNGGIFFHVLDGANFRYCRLKKTATGGRLVIGQVGDPAGDGSVTFARSRKLRLKLGRFYNLRLLLWDSGLVEAFVNGVEIYEWPFPQAVSGRVGLTAARSKSVFDDVQILDDTVLLRR